MERKLYKIILSLVRFPYPQICRHSVALDIINLISESGNSVSEDLIKALCKSSQGDEEAERILLDILSNKEDTC